MGIKTRYQVLKKQKKKRQASRQKIVKAGGNPDDYFSNGIRVKKD